MLDLVRKPAFLPPGRNRPNLDGQETSPLSHVDAIVEGFDRVYRTLLAHRDELLAEGGPLERFADDEVRVLARPTRVYGLILQAATHPDILRDSLDHDRLLDRLWVGIRGMPALERLIPAAAKPQWAILTFWAMAHTKAAISRAIATTTWLTCLPRATNRR